MSDNGNGIGSIVGGALLAVVLFMLLGGSKLFSAQYEAAKADALQARALYVLADASAGAVRAQTAQSWLVPLAASALVVIVVLFIIIDTRRVREIERQRNIALAEARYMREIIEQRLTSRHVQEGVSEFERSLAVRK